MSWDAIVVGAGPAGLVAALRLAQRLPGVPRILVLEAGGPDAIGGRVRMAQFSGIRVFRGAGIGRQRKDRHLYALCRELGLDTRSGIASIRYAPSLAEDPAIQLVRWNRLLGSKSIARGISFRAFGRAILGQVQYDAFVRHAGFSDYEAADAYDVLDSYGMDDNMGRHWTFTVPWNHMIAALIHRLQGHGVEIRTGARVDRVHIAEPESRVDCPGSPPLYSARLVLAVPAASLQKVLPPSLARMYKGIHGQPFLRAYVRLSGRIPGATKTIYVANDLQKIVPFRPQDGIYMVAYADNARARRLMETGHLGDTHESRAFWHARIADALGIPRSRVPSVEAVAAFYWDAGTHYFAPHARPIAFQKLWNPAPGLYVVGEAVARHQGWTEGALESVEGALRGLA